MKMKHLKSFEKLNLDSGYYHLIRKGDFYENYENVAFNPTEIQRIQDFCTQQQISCHNAVSLTGYNIMTLRRRPSSPASFEPIILSKSKDEWYFANDACYNTRYQCDQFEGLMQFIQDRFTED